MSIEFKIHIDSRRIRVMDPQTGYDQQMANRAVVLPKERLTVSLGDPDDKVRGRAIGRLEKSGREQRTRTLFGSSGEDLVYEIQAFQFLTRLLKTQSAPARGLRHYAAGFRGDFDYTLDIPGYEGFPEERRQELEQNLQARLPMRRLKINGKEVHIPQWKRRLETWVRRIFSQALPILVIFAGYLFMPASVRGNWLSFFIFLTLLGYLVYYAGRVAWMMMARLLVPKYYLMCMLQGNHRRISQIDLWLAERVWGVPRASGSAE